MRSAPDARARQGACMCCGAAIVIGSVHVSRQGRECGGRAPLKLIPGSRRHCEWPGVEWHACWFD